MTFTLIYLTINFIIKSYKTANLALVVLPRKKGT
jgi:hypothetical protein